ncbi:TniQ family protein [Catellatospora chokoriensis]|uniref:HTH lysR-type domain-containing protein n=1 Tax=Catellatospora chokoriensis TaxID=310353 RepID=A0A8J3NW74_9ACTN|nr:TniQ family protein [Catellatospora chokoriensis]GIF94646.1 hypothetical protein Cch02nite_80900 [Catellatospora chokoriensis]
MNPATVFGSGVAPERTLPLRVPIADGESLDSWGEHIARRYDIPVRLALPLLGQPWRSLRGDRQHLLVRGTPAPVLRQMERQAGLPDGRLDAAVLERYDPLGWKPLRGSRFCPGCLFESRGRWQLVWRLPWVFACLTHRALLPDRCAACGRMPLRPITGITGLHPAGTCANLLRRGKICDGDLSRVDAAELAAGDSRLATQAWINDRLCGMQADDTAVSAAAHTDLRDLQAVAAWIQHRSGRADFAAFGTQTAAAYDRYTSQRHNGRRPDECADPLLAAALATKAFAMLAGDQGPDLLAQLRPLLGNATRPGSVTRSNHSLSIQPTRWATLSAALQQRLLTSMGTQMCPADQLRYRTCTPQPGLADTTSAATERARYVPQLLWPEWAVRLLPPRGYAADVLRAIIPCCLLLPGHPQPSNAKVVAELRDRWPSYANGTLRRLTASHGPRVLTAICRLADYLDVHASPIDYRRRRAIIADDVLTDDDWDRLCTATLTHRGQGGRYRHARRYTYQLLTGADLTDPRHRLALQNQSERARYRKFTDGLTTPMRAALHQHAAAYLSLHGIDEPVRWAPPGDCLTGLDLPGRDPSDIDLDEVTRLLLNEHRRLGHAARRLNTSTDHVRLALEQVHRPANRTVSTRRSAAHPPGLSPELIQREYVEAGKNLRQMARETGISARTLSAFARACGFTLRNARQPLQPTIDQAWLSQQYQVHHRSAGDIANELRTTDTRVLKALRAFGIPVRANSIHGHRSLVIELDDSIPADVRRAVQGQPKAWQRLRRFQQMAGHTSLNKAARQIGANPSALSTQLGRLERDIGATLIRRATSDRPMTMTPQGQELLRSLQFPAVSELLSRFGSPPAGWKPDHPLRRSARA